VNTFRLQGKCDCPHCGATVDAASGTKETLDPGDVTICAYCHNVCLINLPGLGVIYRKPTEDELVELMQDAKVIEYIEISKQIARQRRTMGNA
jgi:hypothetical protein